MNKRLLAPMLLDWTEDKLRLLDQEQLLTLLENLDRQRAIGRVPEASAIVLDERISLLLSPAQRRKRRRAQSHA
jgi:hypothetical protein